MDESELSGHDDIADIQHPCEIATMQVSVLQGSVLIGTGFLDHLDPPMGVAFGPFTPSPQYERDQHANTVEGDYVADMGKSLAVYSDEHVRIDAAAIAIEDWTQSFDETHLTIFFADGTDFRSFFAQHPDYKSYYGRGD